MISLAPTRRPEYRYQSKEFKHGSAVDNQWAAREQAIEWAEQGHFVRCEWSYHDIYSAYVTPRGDRYGWGLCLSCKAMVEADAEKCRHCGAAS